MFEVAHSWFLFSSFGDIFAKNSLPILGSGEPPEIGPYIHFSLVDQLH